VLDAPGLMALQDAVVEVPVPDHVTQAVLHLTHRSRPGGELADEYIKNYVAWGAGPRASQSLVKAARALALLRGQSAASLEEVKAVAAAVLRHRILPNYNATGDNVTVEQIIEHLVAKM
jgi:MoxR-like ATPase